MEVVVDIIIRIIALIFVAFIIPKLNELIKTKIDENEYNQLVELIKKFVRAAEKYYAKSPKAGDLKKQYVISQLTEIGVEVTKDVEALIEAAVYEIDPPTFYDVCGDMELKVGPEVPDPEE